MFKIEKSQIETIKHVCKSAASRHMNQAFECVLINADSNSGVVVLTAGNGTIEMSSSLSCEVKSSFVIAVNAQKFMQSVESCGDPDVSLKDQLIVKSGRRQFKIQTVTADAYPQFPESVDENKLDISASDLISTIKSVSFAAAKNDVRYVLNGVHIGDDAVATNGHRMSYTSLNLKGSAIVDIDAVNRIPPTITGDVYLSDNVLSIVNEFESFKCKLIDGKYPDYKSVIPKEFNHEVTVNRLDFIDALKAARINAPESGNVAIKFCNESIINSRSGKQEDAAIGFDCETSSDFDMGFNSSYLIEALSVLNCDSVEMKFTDNLVYIESDGIKNTVAMCRI